VRKEDDRPCRKPVTHDMALKRCRKRKIAQLLRRWGLDSRRRVEKPKKRTSPLGGSLLAFRRREKRKTLSKGKGREKKISPERMPFHPRSTSPSSTERGGPEGKGAEQGTLGGKQALRTESMEERTCRKERSAPEVKIAREAQKFNSRLGSVWEKGESREENIAKRRSFSQTNSHLSWIAGPWKKGDLCWSGS